MSILFLLVLVLPGCAGGEEAAHSGGEGSTDVEQEPGARPDVAVTGDGLSETQIPNDDFDRKLVKTAELGIRAEDVRRGAAKAQEVASRYGGSIISSQTYRVGNSVYADLVISVSSGRFENVLDELRGLGEEVTTDTISGRTLPKST